jgi:DNA-directed RNA polymerase specialized sigma24 family protein
VVNLDELSDEALVQQVHAAFVADMAEDFRIAAGVLLKRYAKMIAGRVYGRLLNYGAERLFQDVVQDVNREILAQLQVSRLKPGLRTVFKLTVNTTCRDVVEIALRHEGYSVQSRHAQPRIAKQPDAVPYSQRISLAQPINEDDDNTTLEDVIADNTAPPPEVLVMDRAEQLERMRNLSAKERLMVAVYIDYQDRKLKAEAIAARHGLSVPEVKRYYTEACQILRRNKEE